MVSVTIPKKNYFIKEYFDKKHRVKQVYQATKITLAMLNLLRTILDALYSVVKMALKEIYTQYN